MNESYRDEVSENLTSFITAGNARRERRCKQKIAFLAVTWFTIGLLQEYKNKSEFDAVLWVTYIHHTFTKLEITEGIKYTIRIKQVLLKYEKVWRIKHETMITTFMRESTPEGRKLS